jgi:magnesium chelatase family protein
MSLAVLYSRAMTGMDAPPITVEVHLANGLPNFTIVGLPEAEVKESKDRVRAALQTARFEFPARRITVNLAPADLPKESGRFDLPIALGILAASGQIPSNTLEKYEFAGELALTGELRPILGALAMTLKAHRDGRAFILPQLSALEASLVQDAVIYPANTLLEVCAHLSGREQLPRQATTPPSVTPHEIDTHYAVDEAASQLLKQAITKLDLSARAYHRILKVAGTIADLAGVANITKPHIAEAIQYRRFDKR